MSHDGQLSEPFQINTGVRQGCLLSPFLFTLAVDWIIKVITKGKKCGVQWTPWLQLDDLDFADDLALMSHTKHQMQSKTDTLDEISKSIGLNIHAGKSKILTSERDTIERVTLRNTPLEIVESFTYLGSIIDGKGDKNRKGKDCFC